MIYHDLVNLEENIACNTPSDKLVKSVFSNVIFNKILIQDDERHDNIGLDQIQFDLVQ